MKKTVRAAGAAVISVLMFSSVLPVNAEDTTTTKDESVYVVLNADGSVSSVTVSDQLHNDAGFKNYQDKSDLKDVQNLKNDDEIVTSGDVITWNTDSTDIYYQGTSEKELPLSTTITYTLDGKEVKPEEILGKSGKLEITIHVDNKEVRQYTVNGETYDVAVPFAVVIGGMFKNDIFKNVTIDHGTLQDDSSNSIAAAVMMPGLESSIGCFLTGDLSKIGEYLYDDIKITANVENFESPTLMMAASTDVTSLKEDLQDKELGSTDDLFAQLDELDDATQQLIDGAKQLSEGAEKLNTGALQLNDGAGQILDGTTTLVNGINDPNEGLLYGINAISAGIGQLYGGLGQLVANNSTLNNGMAQVADGILKTVNEGLEEAGLETVTYSDYATKIGDYIGVTDGMRQQARDTIRAQVKAASGVELEDEQIDLALWMLYTGCTDPSAFNEDYVTANIEGVLVQMQTAQATAAKIAQATNDIAAVKSSDTMGAILSAKREESRQAALNVDYNTKLEAVSNNVVDAFTAQGVTLTSDQANLILAASFAGCGAAGHPEATLNTENLSAAAQKIMAQDSATIQTAQAVLTDPATYQFDTFVASVYAQGVDANVNAVSDDEIYGQIVATVASAAGVDTNTAAMILTYAIENNLADANGDLSTAINAAGAEITAAQTVQGYQKQAQTETAQQAIKGILTSMVKGQDSYDSLQEALDSLNGISALVEGLKAYTAGVAECYAGSKTLSDGAAELAKGAKKLQAGAEALNTGAKTLKDGTQELADGSGDLKDGAEKLYEGLQQYNDEGISKLTHNSDLSNLETASELFNAARNDEDVYDNYSGISDGTTGTIKFVYKINTVKAEKTDTVTKTETVKEKTTFFERIANLFKF